MTTPGAFDASDPFTPQARHLAVVSGGSGDPSQTRMLAERMAESASAALSEHGVVPQIHLITLRELATDIAQALVTFAISPALRAALDEFDALRPDDVPAAPTHEFLVARARRGEAPVPGGKEGSPAQLDRAAAAEQRAAADAAKGGAAK